MEGAIYQISLLAAFVAGMVALFAPCCVSYLLPAYLGNVFKERKQVLFMTLVYALGIFVVMMPIVLGARALTALFYSMHDKVYYIGGAFMMVVAVVTLLGIKMPAPKMSWQPKKGNDVVSTFTLGIFSGITSSCCAPVLIGVMTLSSLTPSLLQSLGVGAAYVLGMVTPLFLASSLIHKKNILERPILKKKLTVISLGKRQYPIFVANVVGAGIFWITGALMLVLTQSGKLGMTMAEAEVTKWIYGVATKMTELTGAIPGINLVFAVIAAYLLIRFIKSSLKE